MATSRSEESAFDREDGSKFQIRVGADYTVVTLKRKMVQTEDYGFKRKQAFVSKTEHINQLGSDVLDMILNTYLSSHDRKQARLVCKLWYDKGHRNERLKLFPPKYNQYDFRIEHQYLINCGFKRLHLNFHMVDVNEIPRAVWKKIGPRIDSLEFYRCRLGDRATKNVILRCKNLRVLRVNFNKLTCDDTEDDSFCSLKTLKKITVVRKTLKTLEIYTTSIEFDFEKWKQIFRVLCRIFPNVILYGAGVNLTLMSETDYYEFIINFSKESSSEVDESESIVTALAYSMSMDDRREDWKNALHALSTLRLTSVRLILEKTYESEDQSALDNFFTDQKELKTIEINLHDQNIAKFDKRGSVYFVVTRDVGLPIFSKILVSVLFNILNHCSELRELNFCNREWWLNWLNASQYSELVAKTSKSTLKINGFLIKGSTMRSLDLTEIEFPSWSQICVDGTDDSKISRHRNHEWRISEITPHYSHLQHLILPYEISNVVLQSIFKYLINLKTLQVNVRFCDDDAEYEKCSIKRLQNLERLELNVSGGMKYVSDALYDEFEFPKLRFLYCFLPETDYVLDYIGTKMPSLREVEFFQTDYNFDWEHQKDIFQTTDVTKIFARCSTLRSIRYHCGTYLYEPSAEKVIFQDTKWCKSGLHSLAEMIVRKTVVFW